MSEFSHGAKYARDSILSTIIGLQSDIGCDIESEQYKAYQKAYDTIVKNYGDFMKEFKG